MKHLLLLILCFFFFKVNAQDGYIIKNVTLFDGDKVIPKTSVKIEGKIVAEIAPYIAEDEGLKVIDGEGKFLMSALSNAHVHSWSPKFLKDAAQAGVLNVMDMHGLENFQQFLLTVKDSTQYARFYRAGYAATVPDGHGTQFGFTVPTLQNPEDAKNFIAERIKSNVDFIKIIVEPSMPTLSFEAISALIQEAHYNNLISVVHVSNVRDAITVLKLKADGLAHIWRNKPIAREDLNALVENEKFFIIPTLLTTFKAIDYLGEYAAEMMSKEELLLEIKRLHDAKIPILTGTDPPNFEINFSTDLYEEMLLFEKAGIPNDDILKTATINVAKAFNLEKYGEIKVGYFADTILIDGNPIDNLSDIKNIEMVWKDGKLLRKE